MWPAVGAPNWPRPLDHGAARGSMEPMGRHRRKGEAAGERAKGPVRGNKHRVEGKGTVDRGEVPKGRGPSALGPTREAEGARTRDHQSQSGARARKSATEGSKKSPKIDHTHLGGEELEFRARILWNLDV
ncbi:unnamed protein product [Calypogeia fissa]